MSQSIMKVAVFGSRGVGKASTLRAFLGKKLEDQTGPDDPSEEEIKVVEVPMNGSTTISEDPPNSEIIAQFWYCQKEPISLQTRRKMYSGAICILIMYDVTSYKTFVHATTQLFQEANAMAPDAFKIFIGTKSDLAAERVVEISEMETFSAQNSLFFMEVSAKTLSNIDLVLKVLRIRAKHTMSAAKYSDPGTLTIQQSHEDPFRQDLPVEIDDDENCTTVSTEFKPSSLSGENLTIRSILNRNGTAERNGFSGSRPNATELVEKTKANNQHEKSETMNLSMASSESTGERTFSMSKPKRSSIDENPNEISVSPIESSPPVTRHSPGPASAQSEWAQHQVLPNSSGAPRTRSDHSAVPPRSPVRSSSSEKKSAEGSIPQPVQVRPVGQSTNSRVTRQRRASTQELSMEYESLKRLFESTFIADPSGPETECRSPPRTAKARGEPLRNQEAFSVPGSAGPTVVRVHRTGSIEVETADEASSLNGSRRLHISRSPGKPAVRERGGEGSRAPRPSMLDPSRGDQRAENSWHASREGYLAGKSREKSKETLLERRARSRAESNASRRSRAESNASRRSRTERNASRRSRTERNASRRSKHRLGSQSSTRSRTSRADSTASHRSARGSRYTRAGSTGEEERSDRRTILASEMTIHEKTTVASTMKRRDSMRSIAANGGLSHKDVAEVASGLDHTRTHPKMRQTAFSKWETSAPPVGEYHSTHKFGAKTSSVAPDVIIDVNLGGKLIGSIGAREGDNAAHLASEFVRQHGLSPSHTQRLSDIVKARVDQFYDDEAARIQDAKRQEWAVQRSSHKVTKPLSPQFSTSGSKHETRSVLSENGGPNGQGNQGTRHGRGAIVGKLNVQLGGGKVGHCVIREDDDPKQVARNFCKTYGLKQSRARELEERIQEKMNSRRGVHSHTPNSTPGAQFNTRLPWASRSSKTQDDWKSWQSASPHQPVAHQVPVSFDGLTPSQQELLRKTLGLPEAGSRGKPSPVTTQVSTAQDPHSLRKRSPMWHHPKSSKHLEAYHPSPGQKAKPIFNLDVDIGGGKQERIVVYAGDSPRRLAQEFVTANNLGGNKIPKLESLLVENIRLHNAQQSGY